MLKFQAADTTRIKNTSLHPFPHPFPIHKNHSSIIHYYIRHPTDIHETHSYNECPQFIQVAFHPKIAGSVHPQAISHHCAPKELQKVPLRNFAAMAAMAFPISAAAMNLCHHRLQRHQSSLSRCLRP